MIETTGRKKPPKTVVAKPVKTPEKTLLNTSVLDRSLGYSLRRAQLSTYGEFNQFMDKFDVRPSQFAVLVLVHFNPGLTQTEAASALAIQKANLVGLLDELQIRGVLVRRPVPEDRRVFALHLTRAGEVLMKKVEISHAKLEEKLRRRLDDKSCDQLLTLLHAFSRSEK